VSFDHIIVFESSCGTVEANGFILASARLLPYFFDITCSYIDGLLDGRSRTKFVGDGLERCVFKYIGNISEVALCCQN